MRMKHTVKFQSGSQEIYEFQTKADSDKALKNAMLLNKSFGTIDHIRIVPVNYPEREIFIGFNPYRVYVPNHIKEEESNDKNRIEEFNK